MTAGIDEIAACIRPTRQAKALTQKELGQRVGLPQSHISKIEKGAVDLQLSSLVEIARALGLELKLVPRKALPAVEGVLRAHARTAETSRALHLLNEQAQLAKRIRDSFPELSQTSWPNNLKKQLCRSDTFATSSCTHRSRGVRFLPIGLRMMTNDRRSRP
jgi:transcriptional regulator with XRE-family HTH domain